MDEEDLTIEQQFRIQNMANRFERLDSKDKDKMFKELLILHERTKQTFKRVMKNDIKSW